MKYGRRHMLLLSIYVTRSGTFARPSAMNWAH